MSSSVRIAELFAGVGGFRMGLDGYHDDNHPEFDMPAAGPFHTVWANQWEPGTDRRQFAARCYKLRFGEDSVVNEDIHLVMDKAEAGEVEIPDVDMVVGGFPCQDYSVARTLSQADGIEGKKGVLWWEIYRFLKLKEPRFCLFENVDRLLKSPASQRGRDFAIILSCLSKLGYTAEWRVVNSAEYGCSQRRKRVYIFAERVGEESLSSRFDDGVMARAFPFEVVGERVEFDLFDGPAENSERFGIGEKASPFKEAGVMCGGHVLTAKVLAAYSGGYRTLGDVLVDDKDVPSEFYVEDDRLEEWKALKGAKRVKRVDKKTGFEYWYSEGTMAFPDALDRPSRTILTGEGGVTPSRFKHIIKLEDGRYRRLVPDELDQLQGFPKGWTDSGMTNGQRAFCMGNALVTEVPHRIGRALSEVLEGDGGVGGDAI